jgi:hypothetical protein
MSDTSGPRDTAEQPKRVIPHRVAPLTREVTCIRSLAWRVDLEPTQDFDALSRELCARGFATAVSIAAMRKWTTPEGHEIVIVSRTGRAQIRVHYTIPEEQRRFTAERLYVVLVAAVMTANGEA